MCCEWTKWNEQIFSHGLISTYRENSSLRIITQLWKQLLYHQKVRTDKFKKLRPSRRVNCGHLDQLWNLNFHLSMAGPAWKRFCHRIIIFQISSDNYLLHEIVSEIWLVWLHLKVHKHKNDRRSSGSTLRQNFNLIDIWHLTFDCWHLTFNQWTNGPMDQWTNLPIDINCIGTV